MSKLGTATDYLKSFYTSYFIGTTEEVKQHHERYYKRDKTLFGIEYAWLGMGPEMVAGIAGLVAFPVTTAFVFADTGVRAFTMADRYWKDEPPIGLVGLLREKGILNLE